MEHSRWNENWLLVCQVAACWVPLLLALGVLWPAGLAAQEEPGPAGEAQRRFQAAFEQSETEEPAPDQPPGRQPPGTEEPSPQLNLLELMFRGGWLMVPIVLMSLVVAVFGIERALALRRGRVLPPELVEQLGQMSQTSPGLDPRKVYRLCQRIPCAAANVIRAAMLKVGRPHAEVEAAVKDASQREAEKLYANVRPLLLAAAVTPLLGLLGTVWGMIKAFFLTATGYAQANKAEQLADGIYTALVTTFAGLAVAIPAAVLAHWFEGRIQALFREVDELLLNMMPQLERFEGKLRMQRVPAREEAAGDGKQPAATEPQAAPKGS